MIRKLTILFLLFLLPIGTAIAAGGGGGGGGNGGGNGGGGGSGSSFFSNLVCDDSGKLTFRQKPAIKPVVVHRGDGTNFTLEGDWDGNSFVSEEAVFRDAAFYLIKDPRNGDKTFECPGLIFSCKLVNLNINECTKDGEVNAKFTLTGVGIPSDVMDVLKFQFALFGTTKKLTYQRDVASIELRGLSVEKVDGTTYQLNVPNQLDVSTFQVSYNGCVGRYYVYSRSDCSAKAKSVPGSDLKCGGYLDIEDRVMCRFDLRENEEGEYENFFPEECKERSDWEDCLEVYQLVQKCWASPNGPARIQCVKNQLKLGDIKEEKSKCLELEPGERGQCISSLRGKVYDLVKFRLYNLEEEAEVLLGKGRLERKDAIDFTVKMDQIKLAFNKASTNEERKSLILQARQYWIELMKKLKAVEE